MFGTFYLKLKSNETFRLYYSSFTDIIFVRNNLLLLIHLILNINRHSDLP